VNIHGRHNEAIGKQLVEALKKNLFDAIYFNTKEEAAEYIMENIEPGISVGFGGSMTIKAMGIENKVREKGGEVINHNNPELSAAEKYEIMRKELTSDLFLCSTNAVTLDGELVNIDGAGNRVAALSFGPKKVIVATGINKICRNIDSAFERLETVASPKNNIRFDNNNPCTKTGVCMDCKGAGRICRIYSVLKRRPMASNITVVVIGESMGF